MDTSSSTIELAIRRPFCSIPLKPQKWAGDIKDTQGTEPTYPMIGDTDLRISALYGMLPASASGDASVRTPADNQTMRNISVIGPDKKIKLIIVYPMTTGRDFDKLLCVIDSLQLTAKYKARGGPERSPL